MSAYITAADLAIYLGLENTDDDPLLTTLIAAASEKIDSETGRTFAAASDTTRYFDESAVIGSRLYFDTDLCQITSITNGDGASVASSQYVGNPRNVTPWYAIELKRTASVAWDGYSGEIAVVGRWAYSIDPDAAIKHATERLAGWYYRQRDNASESDRVLITGTTTILPARVPADVADALKVYKVRT